MTSIQSSTGLITGIPIQDTVDQLMALAAQPKTNLTNRTKNLQNEKVAVTQLSTLLVALQFETKQFKAASLFDARQVASSNTAALTATLAVNGTPVVGNYQFTPLQTASAQQLLSQSFSTDSTIGAGTLTIGTGGQVAKGISLNQLNGGNGIVRGKIRVTDRSGASAVIDLSLARTVDDVLSAINENTTINVTASTDGDSFKITDNSGGSANLKLQEVSGGTTASSLGLAGIDTGTPSATGNDVFTLYAGTTLASLNDGMGVELRSGNDLSFTLKDGSTVDVDLGSAKTLGDVLTAINAASPTTLSASIGTDGNRIKLTDLTTGGGTFAVANVGDGTAADALKLTTAAADDTITGGRLASGLRDTLVSTLKGGQGLGTLGQISITNRNNVSSTVDLTGAETLGQIIKAFNTQAVGVTAGVNASGTGITLTDKTGASASNLVIGNGDSNNSATALGVTANTTGTSVNSGRLDRQQISRSTLLSSLNDGAGIDVSSFKITDSAGHTDAVDLKPTDNVAVTLGDVIDRINALTTAGVEARINDRGDGIELIDTAAGTGKLTVTEVGNHTTAKDLRILGTSVTQDIGGTPTEVIDGSASSTIAIAADDTLTDVVDKINALKRGVTASVIRDGTGQRLSITADKTGAAAAVAIDTTGTALSLQEVSEGQDALLVYGTGGAGGVLISSSSNTFNEVIDGLDVTINDATGKAVTVSVQNTSASAVANAKEFVAAYNSLRSTLGKMTVFNADDLTTGILFGTQAALRVDSDLSHAITSRFFGVGQFQSLEQVGISVDDKGNLKLDESKFSAAFAKDPEAMKKFFTDDKLGVSQKLNDVIEQLAGKDNSLLASRSDALTDTINANNKRLEDMTTRLDKQREVLLNVFYTLESTVAKMKDNLSALQSFQIIPPLTSSN